MKLLFDENLARSLAANLGEVFPGSSHVVLEGLRKAGDLQIWRYAAESGFVIVTKDSDFRELVTLHRPPPKVIMIRLGNCRTADVLRLMMNNFDTISAFGEDSVAGLLILE